MSSYDRSSTMSYMNGSGRKAVNCGGAEAALFSCTLKAHSRMV